MKIKNILKLRGVNNINVGLDIGGSLTKIAIALDKGIKLGSNELNHFKNYEGF